MTEITTSPSKSASPIDMVLHCPKCGLQHIDAPEPAIRTALDPNGVLGWPNPPHRSHLCHGCGHIWRPADVPTNGVRAIKTTGKADRPVVAQAAPAAVAGPSEAEPLHITHGPLMRHAATLLRMRKPVLPDHESVATELELAAEGHPTPSGEPSPEWLEVLRLATLPTTQAAPQPAAPQEGDLLHASVINRIWRECEGAGLDHVAFAWRVQRAAQPQQAVRKAQEDAEDAARWRYSVKIGENQVMNWLDVYDDWNGEGFFTDAIDAARSQAKEEGA